MEWQRWIAASHCFRRQGVGPAGGWNDIGSSMSDEVWA